jgi:hypothetical protein
MLCASDGGETVSFRRAALNTEEALNTDSGKSDRTVLKGFSFHCRFAAYDVQVRLHP